MKEWKLELIKKLEEKAKDLRQVSLYDTARENGINHIKTQECREIAAAFCKSNKTYKAVQLMDPTLPESTQSLFTTLVFTELDYSYDEDAPMANLKRLRLDNGLSQSKLAEQADVSVRMIQNYEQGAKDINKAQAITLKSIADVLGCSIEDLLEL